MAGGSVAHDASLQEKYNRLEEDHSKLQMELEQQQKVTEEVRAEASAFLEEMRTLAEHDTSWSTEKQTQEIEALKNEAKEWKARYAKSKAQVRNLRALAYGTNSAFAQPSIQSIQSEYLSPHGMINEVSVGKFQTAMDAFILQSRMTPSKGMMEQLHGVVVATRVITQDVGSCPVEEMHQLDSNLDQLQGELAQATSLVSATANHLITTARNHSTSGGLSPLFLLDAAASDLAAAVIDLVKLAKVRPSSCVSENDSTTNGAKGAIVSAVSANGLSISDIKKSRFKPGHHKQEIQEVSHLIDQELRNSPAIEEQAMIRELKASKFNTDTPDLNTVSALQEYLENQTVGVIDGIQELLTGIKGNYNYSMLHHNIILITDNVQSMLEAVSGMMKQTKHWQLKEHAAYIVDNLENCSQRMRVLYGDSEIYDKGLIPDKQFKQRLAGISFDLAKCTTELVKTVEEVNLKQEINNIDEALHR